MSVRWDFITSEELRREVVEVLRVLRELRICWRETVRLSMEMVVNVDCVGSGARRSARTVWNESKRVLISSWNWLGLGLVVCLGVGFAGATAGAGAGEPKEKPDEGFLAGAGVGAAAVVENGFLGAALDIGG